jgi:NAD-dependent SIR2 family protein deacetylase
LNYDLVLDHALVKEPSGGQPFASFRHHSLSLLLGDDVTHWELFQPGKLIQLHGALNWWRCPNAECREYQQIHLDPFGEWTRPSGHQFTDHCRACGHPRKRAIVPPTMKGVFGTMGRVGFLWHMALDALSAIEKAVIIGVSLPASDYVLGWLIREARRRIGSGPFELIVVNPFTPRRTARAATLRDVLSPVVPFA